MKRFTYLLLPLLFGCSSQLEIYPEDKIAVSDISESDIPIFANGVLEVLKDAFAERNNGVIVLDFDNYGENFGGENGAIFNSLATIEPSNGYIEDVWIAFYRAIFNAVELINLAGQYSSTTANHGEATGRYARAFAYYQLVTRWGGVPLIEQNTVASIPRSTEDDTWAFIINDLLIAHELAPPFSTSDFVSKEAIAALLSRVYLFTNNKQEALVYAQEVLNSTRFSLEADYRDIYANDGGSELIFGLNNFESTVDLYEATNTSDFEPSGNYSFMPREEVYQTLFATEDSIRRDATIIEYNEQLMLNKYATNTTMPVIVSRISEMYLIKAEALGYEGGGIAVLNELREGRGLSTYSISSEEAFEEAIFTERKIEFFGEGMLFYDLVRLEKAIEELFWIDEAYQTKLPIPQREVDIAELDQNPGY